MAKDNENTPVDETQVTDVPADDSSAVTKSTSDAAPADQPAEEVDLTGGVADGTVEKTDEEVPVEVRDRIDHEEKVVHDTDEDGNVVGWHKEPVEGTPPEQDVVFDPSVNSEEGQK